MTGSVGRARAALRSRDFRLLLGVRLLSQFADGLFQAFLIAELVFLNPEKHSTAVGVAKAYAVLIIPFSVVAPVAGVLIDRWSRRRILAVVPLIRAAAALAMLPARGGSSLVFYAPALVVVSLNRFLLTTAAAVTPVMVAQEHLLVANAMGSVGGTVVTFVGIVAGTKLAGPIGSHGLLVVTAVAWPAAAMLASLIRRPLRAIHPEGAIRARLRRVLPELGSGARRLAATPAAVGPITSIALDQLLIGFVIVLSLVVFKEQFKAGVGSYGNIVAAGGVGVLAGTLTVGWFEPRMAKPRIVALAFAVAGIVCLAVAPDITGLTILLVSFALGLTFAWRKVPTDTIVQEAVPNRFRGRVFAVNDISYSMARVVAAAVAIPVIPRLSTGRLLAITGAIYLAWTPVLPWWMRRPRYAKLRFYAGGRADETPKAIVVAGEEQPVEVLASRLEERSGRRLRRFILRTPDGTELRVAGDEAGGKWRIEDERRSEDASDAT